MRHAQKKPDTENQIYFGSALGSWSVDDLLMTDISYGSRLRLDRHFHEQDCCVLTISGSVQHWSRSEVVCQPGSLLFVSAGDDHVDEFSSDGASCFIVTFGRAWLSRMQISPRALDPKGVVLWPDRGTPAQIASKMRDECQAANAIDQLIISGLALELIGHMHRVPSEMSRSVPGWLTGVQAALQDCFAAPPSLPTLGRLAGVHPVHLAREFKRVHSCTVGEYVRRARFAFVLQQLRETSRPLSQIAMDAGFNSQAHMSSAFRKRFSLSPSECRARAGRSSVARPR